MWRLIIVFILVACEPQKPQKVAPIPPTSFRVWHTLDKNLYLDLTNGEFDKPFDAKWIYRHRYGGECYAQALVTSDGKFTISRSTWATCSSDWDPGCWTRNMSGKYEVKDNKLYLCADGAPCEVFE